MAQNNEIKDNSEEKEEHLKNEISEEEIIENVDAEKLEDEEFEELKNDRAALEEELSEVKLFRNKLKDENTKLKNELETVKERLVRTAAEYENFRNRTTKEKEGIYNDACFDVLKNVLPALDNMERAVAIDGSLDDIKQGIDMTIRQFKDSLSKLGVEEIETSGAFDPNLHNAIMHVEDENLGENEIVEVLQKGYKKGDKVLRYSMVKVAN